MTARELADLLLAGDPDRPVEVYRDGDDGVTAVAPVTAVEAGDLSSPAVVLVVDWEWDGSGGGRDA